MQPVLYIDTNILIYLLEQHPEHGTQVADKLENHVENGGLLITSAITVTEFLAGRSSESAPLVELPGLEFIAVSKTIAEAAGGLRQLERLEIGDALHLATALNRAEATEIFTNDKQFAAVAKKHLSVTTL